MITARNLSVAALLFVALLSNEDSIESVSLRTYTWRNNQCIDDSTQRANGAARYSTNCYNLECCGNANSCTAVNGCTSGSSNNNQQTFANNGLSNFNNNNNRNYNNGYNYVTK